MRGRITKKGKVIIAFSRTICKNCAFFRECVGEGTAKARTLYLTAHYEIIRQRRVEQEREAFRDEMRVRSQVEGTVSEAVRFLGLRYVKYKGENGHKLQFFLTGAALNVKRLARTIVNGRVINKNPVMAFAR